MSKRTKRSDLDVRVAEYLGLRLDDAISMKHAQTLKGQITALHFARKVSGGIHVESVPCCNYILGRHVSSPKFAMNRATKEQLIKHEFSRWFVSTDKYLYVIQVVKVDALFDAFPINVTEGSRVVRAPEILDIEYDDSFTTMFLRKKPLQKLNMFTPTWQRT